MPFHFENNFGVSSTGTEGRLQGGDREPRGFFREEGAQLSFD